MPTERPRYTIIVNDELLKKIDDFRFENRYPSRSAATLELIKLGIEVLEQKLTNKIKKISLSAKTVKNKNSTKIIDDFDIEAELESYRKELESEKKAREESLALQNAE
jgi:metal-responsive CopG/Arc/MetJ family transcriptional regulator